MLAARRRPADWRRRGRSILAPDFGDLPEPGTAMRRICLCLLFAFATATVAAREVKLSSADSGSCAQCADAGDAPRASTHKPDGAHDVQSAHEGRSRPTVHSDVNAAPRLRWHSFVPGMFR